MGLPSLTQGIPPLLQLRACNFRVFNYPVIMDRKEGPMIVVAETGAIVISLRNGTENADILRGLLPDHDLRAGMVEFNVVPMGQRRFHQSTTARW